ncbi:MAG: hypothetical protein JW811_00845 [Clostridiales bacterium]|nr:hypothetical protein [Clostridiales bacterium]
MKTDVCGKPAGTLPATGRIGRFVKILETETDGDTFREHVKNADRYASYNAEEKSAWWNGAVEALETKPGKG